MAGRGAGRGRGRPRDAQAQGAQGGFPAAPQAGRPRGRGRPRDAQGGFPPPQSATAPMPQQAMSAAPPVWRQPVESGSRATHRPPPQTDVTQTMQAMSLGGGSGNGAGPSSACPAGRNGNGSGAAGPVGRGALRGTHLIGSSIKVTKPDHVNTKQGCSGGKVGLIANYFSLKTFPNWVLRQYRVDVAPEEDRTRERQNLLRVHRERLGGYLFDGTMLFTINPLTSRQSPTIVLTSHNRDQTQVYTLTIKEVGEVGRFDYAYIQVFNLLLRSCISALGLQLVGRDYYDADAKVAIQAHRLELWPGYKTSIRQHERGILMCVEITHKVMRMETALDILNDCYQRDRNNYKISYAREVLGCIVLTKYNNKTYRIDDVEWDKNPTHTFLFKNEEITFSVYMQRKYGISIRDMGQPMLVSRAKARDVRAGMSDIVRLLPEVCYLTGLTDNMRNNFQLMKALAVHTRVSPASRIEKLINFNRRLMGSEQAMSQLQRFQMTLERDLVKLPGRVIMEEKIFFAGGKCASAGPDVDWTRELRKVQLLLAKELKQWVVLTPGKSRRDAGAFVEALKKSAAGMRFLISDPQWEEVQGDNTAAYVKALGAVLDRGQPQLIMCAVPNNRGDRYSAIKKKCCVDRPVPTQVILCKNLNDPRKQMSIATKVSIQLNCKIGGAPWRVEIPPKNFMVIGFDVCHDTSNKSQSYGAMVASLDQTLARYFSSVTPHRDGEELSNKLGLDIVKALRKYQDINRCLPASILIYRDGVGEGQIPFVHSTELESIKAKLAQVYQAQQATPKLTFVIVTKRINTRLFTESKMNPRPGTVVDDIVTDPEKYDFFLVSQSVREGTVSPTSYNVIWDDMKMDPDYLQKLTYKMCHLYFNWSGTVRVPAPCQYAHKLAYLVGQSIHREPSSSLDTLLYFL